MPEATQVEADFYTDLLEFCEHDVRAAGFKIRVHTGRKRYLALIQFCEAELRHVSARPREVILHPGFECPEADREGLRLFFGKVERGEHLMRHGNERIMRPNADDGLLRDWGIHHFHLGTVEEPNGFMSRTKNLLFARVTLDALYALAVWPHEDDRGEAPWARQDFIRTLHRNWPHLLEHARLDTPLGFNPASDENVQAWRNAGATTPIRMDDGTEYLLIGGGPMASRRAQAYVHAVGTAELTLKTRAAEIPELAANAGVALPERLRFKLGMDSDWIYGTEVTTGLGIRLTRRPPRPW